MVFNELDALVRARESWLGTLRTIHIKHPHSSGQLTMLHVGTDRPMQGIAGVYYFESLTRDDITRAVSAAMITLGNKQHQQVMRIVSEVVGMIGYKPPKGELSNDSLLVDIKIIEVSGSNRWWWQRTTYTVALFVATDEYARHVPPKVTLPKMHTGGMIQA